MTDFTSKLFTKDPKTPKRYEDNKKLLSCCLQRVKNFFSGWEFFPRVQQSKVVACFCGGNFTRKNQLLCCQSQTLGLLKYHFRISVCATESLGQQYSFGFLKEIVYSKPLGHDVILVKLKNPLERQRQERGKMCYYGIRKVEKRENSVYTQQNHTFFFH